MFEAIAQILAGLTGPQALVLLVVGAAIFGGGLAMGRAIWRPRPDFRRYVLPPHSRGAGRITLKRTALKGAR